jgi:hypothetical protein
MRTDLLRFDDALERDPAIAKAKTYTIKATYPGDAFHMASSGTVKQVVNP